VIELKRDLEIYEVAYIDEYANRTLVGVYLHADDADNVAKKYNSEHLDENALCEARITAVYVRCKPGYKHHGIEILAD
jgi:hypothetical protein